VSGDGADLGRARRILDATCVALGVAMLTSAMLVLGFVVLDGSRGWPLRDLNALDRRVLVDYAQIYGAGVVGWSLIGVAMPAAGPATRCWRFPASAVVALSAWTIGAYVNLGLWAQRQGCGRYIACDVPGSGLGAAGAASIPVALMALTAAVLGLHPPARVRWLSWLPGAVLVVTGLVLSLLAPDTRDSRA